MKRIITIRVVMALDGGAAVARGNNEEANGNRQGFGMQDAGATVTYTGTVEEIDGHVVLNSNGTLYSLSAPGFTRAGVEVPYGETIEVKGTMNTEPCDDCDLDAAGHIFVRNATVNGEELAFANGRSDNDDKRGNAGQDGNGQGNNGRSEAGMGNKADNDSRGMGRDDVSQGNSRRGSSGRSGSGRNGDSRDGQDFRQNSRWNNPEA